METLGKSTSWYATLTSVALLFGCSSSEPIDCPAYFSNLDSCVDNARAKEVDFRWSECLPYSDPIIITGIYANGFEHNVFWEGPYADMQDLWSIPEVVTSLDIDRPLRTDGEGNRLNTLSEIKFIGRRPLCVPISEERWLAVDEILEEKVIESRQSGF